MEKIQAGQQEKEVLLEKGKKRGAGKKNKRKLRKRKMRKKQARQETIHFGKKGKWKHIGKKINKSRKDKKVRCR